MDVRDVGRVAAQHVRQVLTHLAEVVEVGQEGEVGHRGLRPHQVDHLEGARAGDQGRARAVVGVQRLHDHGRARGRGGPGGQREVLRGQFVLLLRGKAVRPVPVQRVEDGAAGPRGDAGAGIDVVPERGRALRQRQQPAAPAAMSPPAKFSKASRTPASASAPVNASTSWSPGTDAANGHQSRDRVRQPGGPRRRGPSQQRQFGEQDRAVDGEPQSLCAHSRQSLMLIVWLSVHVQATRQRVTRPEYPIEGDKVEAPRRQPRAAGPDLRRRLTPGKPGPVNGSAITVFPPQLKIAAGNRR